MSEFPQLPAEFVYGAATASYQIEGAVQLGGRGTSIWDTFVREPGRIKNGETGDVACDSYHRYGEDVALMKDLGLDAYRFSIAWPRIQPTGQGPANEAGLDYYDKLVDELLTAGIAPAATLFHWDMPQALQDAGGWQSRETAQRLADYATIVADRLGDRVAMWMPLNEPVVVTLMGHALGIHAPGLELGFDALPIAHHQLLGHGLAVQALRAAGATNIGIASNHAPTWAGSDSDEDKGAAELYDSIYNWLFADPILKGTYPDGFAEAMPGPVEEDLKTISSPLDFFGINYYQPAVVSAPGSELAGPSLGEGVALPADLPFQVSQATGHETTDFGWAIVPNGLREILVTFKERYGDRLPPIYITESGCSFHDVVGSDGAVHDEARISYHAKHLRAVAEAIDVGVDVRGYFAWSLLDNFEWAEGYEERFGLVHVDFDSLTRTPKDSYHWFQQHLTARQPA
ncbi:GH1 family beta-glucosidase [Luteipulveratus mongoliensis]|uniref:Beta-glucosidase n=1 Tax=Luteipulveratus mongoliensis TaxID=571913 RepID=A0A0K1JFK2_9MICO|nr:GH1 family beta-glucosidase [Luteipulveratus mongoliensis]AKU15481.1 beta-glucosidase [Luteipulveratus mongoliensis]